MSLILDAMFVLICSSTFVGIADKVADMAIRDKLEVLVIGTSGFV